MQGAWKRFYFARRNPAIAATSFPSAWKAHSDLLQTMPALARRFARYAYCVTDADEGSVAAPHCDGIGVFWMDDADAHLDQRERQARFALADPTGSGLMRADELRVFAAPVADAAGTAVESVVRAAPLEDACLFAIFRDRAEGAAPVCRQAGRTRMGAIAGIAAVRTFSGRVALNMVVSGNLAAAMIAEFWFSPEKRNNLALSLSDLHHALAEKWRCLSPGGMVQSVRTSLCHAVATSDPGAARYG